MQQTWKVKRNSSNAACGLRCSCRRSMIGNHPTFVSSAPRKDFSFKAGMISRGSAGEQGLRRKAYWAVCSTCKGRCRPQTTSRASFPAQRKPTGNQCKRLRTQCQPLATGRAKLLPPATASATAKVDWEQSPKFALVTKNFATEISPSSGMKALWPSTIPAPRTSRSFPEDHDRIKAHFQWLIYFVQPHDTDHRFALDCSLGKGAATPGSRGSARQSTTHPGSLPSSAGTACGLSAGTYPSHGARKFLALFCLENKAASDAWYTTSRP